MKIYLSGPMTGFPDFNYGKFNKIAAKLRTENYIVYNPAEFEYEDLFPARQAFKEYMAWICDYADAIFMLDGWEKSKGARAEHALAIVLGLKILYETP